MLVLLLMSLMVMSLCGESNGKEFREWVWSKASISGRAREMSSREGHSAVSLEHYVVVFGGCYLDKICFNDVTVLDTNTMSWVSPIVDGLKPMQREGHSAALHGTRMLVFGGSSEVGYLNDLHVLDMEPKYMSGNEPHMAWGQPSTRGDGPSPREGHSGTMTEDGMIVFGGYSGRGGYTNDLYMLSLDDMKWKKLDPTGSVPSPREGHAATSFMDKLVVFGGRTDRGKTALNDVYVLDTKSMSWSQANMAGSPPNPRQDASAIRHGSNKILVVGGCNLGERTCYNDAFQIDLANKRWEQIDVKSNEFAPRADHTMTIVRNRVFLIGGCFLDHNCFGGDEVLELESGDEWRCGGNNCTDNGVCRHDICMCLPGFTGHDCAERIGCPRKCSGHGRCLNTGKCACMLGYSGRDCSLSEVCPQKCTGRGECLADGTCRCVPGWSGKACDVCRVGSRAACNAKGVCRATKTSTARFASRPILSASRDAGRDGARGVRFVSGGTALLSAAKDKINAHSKHQLHLNELAVTPTYACACDKNWAGPYCTVDAKATPPHIDAPKETKKKEETKSDEGRVEMGTHRDVSRVSASSAFGSNEPARDAVLKEKEGWWDNPPGTGVKETVPHRLASLETSIENSTSLVEEVKEEEEEEEELSVANDATGSANDIEMSLLKALTRGIVLKQKESDGRKRTPESSETLTSHTPKTVLRTESTETRDTLSVNDETSHKKTDTDDDDTADDEDGQIEVFVAACGVLIGILAAVLVLRPWKRRPGSALISGTPREPWMGFRD